VRTVLLVLLVWTALAVLLAPVVGRVLKARREALGGLELLERQAQQDRQAK
jgi:hypothetical protein